ncbi:transglycosylase family protein [Kitasatospora terrestris]|uniref:Resuscitation-promoting factor core lysozyme-like domain-containing protein n=1 Tax=Kitasatospora terrestris TaxID=258051 RepID=A0ABP9ERP3_9ACTN
MIRKKTRTAAAAAVALGIATTALAICAGPAQAASVATWDKVAQCESSGNWAANTGNAHYGGLQFDLPTWQGYGGTQYAAYPHQATKQQQILIAEKVLNGPQGYHAWECWPNTGLDTDRTNPYPAAASSVGVFRPSNATFYLSNGGYASFGANGDVPLSGDWNGDGKDTFGVYRPSDQKFYLTDNNSTAVKQPKYGNPGDVPLVGDWNGDGVDSIGVYRPSDQTFYLTNDDNATEVYHVKLGVLGDKPIVGDWNGDGKDTVGIYRPSDQTFAMTDSTTGGTTTTHNFKYGNPGDAPIKGDWDGDGRDEVGVYRAQYSDFIEATFDGGGVYSSPRYGVNGDIPVIGQW